MRTITTIGIADTVRFSPDGKTLAIVTEPNTEYQSSPMHYSIEIWDTATWQRKRIISEGDFFLDFSLDSKSLFGMCYSVKQWDVANGRVLTDEKNLGFPRTMSPDRKMILSDQWTANRKNSITGTTLYLWDTLKKRVRYHWTFLGGDAVYNEASFSPDGTVLADVLNDHSMPEKSRLILWDMKTGRQLSNPKALPRGVLMAAFSPDGNTLATAGYQPLILWDRTNGQQQRTLPANFSQLLQIRFSNDGKWIYALGNSTSSASSIVWEVKSGREVLRDNGRQPMFSNSGPFFSNVDKALTIWDLTTGRKSALFSNDKPHFFPGFSTDDHLLAAPRVRSTYVDIWAVPSP